MIIECPECGEKNQTSQPPQPGKRYRCGKCGAVITFLQSTDTQSEATPSRIVEVPENTSGQGKLTIVPREIRGWNWGAFFLNWIWSIGNNVWIGLLCIIPYAGIIMNFVLGAKGNEWAWRSKRWDSIEHFRNTQRTWTKWGIGLIIVPAILGILAAVVIPNVGRFLSKGEDEARITEYNIETPVPSTKPITTPRKITLSDAENILNILPFLPKTFEEVDSASEGISNADLGLGPDFSEVYLFLSDEPFQMIYGCLGIIDSRIEQAYWDSAMKDESQIKNLIIESIKAGILEEGGDFQNPEIQITHPSIGNSAIFGEGHFSSYDITIGFDTIWFRIDNVYVIFYSGYQSLSRQSLLPIAKELERRIGQYSQ